MITYQKEPLLIGEASRLKAWLASPEANLFRKCAESAMNMHYFDAINTRSKRCNNALDRSKVNNLAMQQELDGQELQRFIEMFEFLSQPENGFFTLKVNT